MCILSLAIHIFFLPYDNNDKISRRSISIPFRSHIYGHENEMYNVGLNLKEVERL